MFAVLFFFFLSLSSSVSPNSIYQVWPWLPGHLQVTEPWLAFLQENDFGLGIYTAAPEVQSASGTTFNMVAGFAGAKGSGGTADSPTGYMAPVAATDLAGDGTWSYSFSVIIGNVADIRSAACALWRNDWLNASGTATRQGPAAGAGEARSLPVRFR